MNTQGKLAPYGRSDIVSHIARTYDDQESIFKICYGSTRIHDNQQTLNCRLCIIVMIFVHVNILKTEVREQSDDGVQSALYC